MNSNLHLPFRVEELPQSLQPIIRQSIASEVYAEAIDVLETYIDEQGKTNADLLAALAFCLFEDALTVMVDEVISLGERSIELLKEAKKQGLPVETAAKFRARVKRIVDREKKREAQLLALIDQPIETFNLQQVQDLAYLLSCKPGERNARHAARLNTVAAAKAEQLGQDPNLFRCRAALSLAAAKCWEEALPQLREMIAGKVTLPDQCPGDNGSFNQSYVLIAYYRLFDYHIEQNDRHAFEQLWQQAHAEMPYFPVAWPVQDQLLQVAYDWKMLFICQHLLKVISTARSARQISSNIKELMQKVQASIDQEHPAI